MNLLHVRFAAFFLLCLTFLACGGGGGGGGGTGGGGVSITLTPATGTVGHNGNFPLAAVVTGSSNPDVTWSATAGTLNITGVGQATWIAPAADVTATVTATSVADPTKSDSSSVTSQAGLATVTGRVVRQNTSQGLGNVVIEFRDGSGATVATATTNAFGYFGGGTPTTAVRFHVQNTTVPSGYYRQYLYNSLRYATTISTCSAPLPALAAGTNTALLTVIGIPVASGPPPPPPNGCQ